jgi:hypothetical protein
VENVRRKKSGKFSAPGTAENLASVFRVVGGASLESDADAWGRSSAREHDAVLTATAVEGHNISVGLMASITVGEPPAVGAVVVAVTRSR